jgi:uncharacterized membrane protein YfhO
MEKHKPENNPNQRIANITLTVLAAQSGCLSLVLVFGALLLGLWLDAQTGQRGPFTVGLLLLSIPISLFVMVRVALSAVKQIQPPRKPLSTRRRDTDEEEV